MKLTDHQQKMLDGAFGKGKAMAMQIQIGVGKCFDAERLVPVSRAHVSLSAQEADIWFAGKLLDAGLPAPSRRLSTPAIPSTIFVLG